MKNWTLEDNVNDWVKAEFARIKQTNYKVESSMSDCLKDAIQKGVHLKRMELEEAGEKEKGKSWKPDFHLETFDIPRRLFSLLICEKFYQRGQVYFYHSRLKPDLIFQSNPSYT